MTSNKEDTPILDPAIAAMRASDEHKAAFQRQVDSGDPSARFALAALRRRLAR